MPATVPAAEESTSVPLTARREVWWGVAALTGALAVWRWLDGGLGGLALVVTVVLLLGAALGAALDEPEPPWAVGLPGFPDTRPDLGVLRERAHLLGLVVLTAAALGFALGHTGIAVGAVAAALVLRSLALGAWLWHGWRLRRALVRYRPTVALSYAGRSGGPWQLRMWEPFVLESGERCVVFNRHEKYFEAIREGARLTSPLVSLGASGFLNLGFVVVPSLTAMFYVQNAQSNRWYMKYRHITHVWLNHGDSDKPANFNPRHALYDVLVVTGEGAKDRYAKAGIEIPDEKFAVVGRPQIRGVDTVRRDLAAVPDPRVLYAPTWAGIEQTVNFSSLKVGPQIVTAMLDRGLTVVFRPHPLSRRGKRHGALIRQIETLLERDREQTGRAHVWGEQASSTWTVVDCANHVDALVSDISSVVSDFLPSGKPYAMTMMQDQDPEAFRAQNSLAAGAYLVRADLGNLAEVLDAAFGADPLADQRLQLRRDVLSDRTGEEAAEAFAQLVRDLVARGHRRD